MFKLDKKSAKKIVATKLEEEGIKALVAGPLKKILFLRLALTLFLMGCSYPISDLFVKTIEKVIR